MSKELKAPDKVTQKMTRDGAVAENLTTGETSSISERPQEENYSAPAGVAAEKVVQHIGAEIERHAAKGAEKKALDATQPKTHSSRLQFSEAERATPELQKAIKKSDKAADCLDAARAAIPKQTKIKKERVFDEAKGKAKTRLSFEKTDKPPNGKLRHNPLSRPAQELKRSCLPRSGKQSALVPVAARRFMRARKTTTVPTGLAALSCGKMTCSFSSAKRLSQRRLPPPF